VIGVLVEAKRRGFIPVVAPLLAQLRNEMDFYIHPQFEAEALKGVNEVPEQ
jgi:predicted nucleic acid-binding protein